MRFSSGQEVFLTGDAENELSHKPFSNASCLTVPAIYEAMFQWMKCGVAGQKNCSFTWFIKCDCSQPFFGIYSLKISIFQAINKNITNG